MMCVYIYIYIYYVYRATEGSLSLGSQDHSCPGFTITLATYISIFTKTSYCVFEAFSYYCLLGSGSFTSQDLDVFLRSVCADSSSPKVSAIFLLILHGKLTVSAIHRKTLQQLRGEMSKSWLAKLTWKRTRRTPCS